MRAHKFILGAMLLSISAFGSMYFGGGGGADDTSIARDGTRPPTADQPWGNFRLLGVSRIGVGASGSASYDDQRRVVVADSQSGNAIRIVSKNTASDGSGEIVSENDSNGQFIMSSSGTTQIVGDLISGPTGTLYGNDLSNGFLFTTPTASKISMALGGFATSNLRFQLQPSDIFAFTKLTLTDPGGAGGTDLIRASAPAPGNASRIVAKNTSNDGSGEIAAENDIGDQLLLAVVGSNQPLGDLVPARGGLIYGGTIQGGITHFLTNDGSPKYSWAIGGLAFADERFRIELDGVKVRNTDLRIETAGRGIEIAEGADAKMGVATLVAGTVTVSTTAVAADSRIMLTCQDPNGGTPGAEYISARNAGTDFTITSTSGTDTCIVAWLIVDPS